MSVNATRFAWEYNLSKTTKRSAKRLVLLALADRANKENTCFPSIARIVKDTCMDRKTVMNTIKDLIDLGVISDTGERKGGTNQVRVLKINVETIEQESYPHVDQKHSNKQCEISEQTVVNLPINGVEFHCNSGKFGTQNLKESLIKYKINIKSEKYLKINKNEIKSETDGSYDQQAVNAIQESVNHKRTSDSSEVLSACDTFIPEQCKTSNTSSESFVQQRNKEQTWNNHKKSEWTQKEKSSWIPKHLYHAHMKQKHLDEQQNKEPFIPKSMIQGWEDGMLGNPNATKGVPDHLLNNPKLAKMLKRKQRQL